MVSGKGILDGKFDIFSQGRGVPASGLIQEGLADHKAGSGDDCIHAQNGP